ncbi:MAG: DUF4112 domain-containing protein, partial [Bradyrhizobium sp.]
MANEEIISPGDARFTSSRRGGFGGRRPQGPMIDQEGREIPLNSPLEGFGRFHFDFAHSGANPFGDLTRDQRMA